MILLPSRRRQLTKVQEWRSDILQSQERSHETKLEWFEDGEFSTEFQGAAELDLAVKRRDSWCILM